MTKEELTEQVKQICVDKWKLALCELKNQEDIAEVKAIGGEVAKWLLSNNVEVYESWDLAGQMLAARLLRKKSKVMWNQFKLALFEALPIIFKGLAVIAGL